jgi:hypothetical protein
MTDSTMIRVKKNTKERIAKYGKYGQSMDDIINFMADELDKKISKAEEKAFNDLSSAALSASRKRGKT